jgi:uncharacterized OsmC-like protein
VVGDVTGEIEKEGGVLVIRRIHVIYRLRGIPDAKRETVERVRALHADGCPVARTIANCVEIRTSVEFVE